MPMLTTVRMRRPVAPCHDAVADPVGERRHPAEHLVDVGDDVVAVEHDLGAGRGAQGDVEHGAVLGDVDPLGGEHGVAPAGDVGLDGDRLQGGEHGVVDALLGVVDAQVADGEDVALGARRVGGEQLAQVRRAGHVEQVGPRRRAGDVGSSSIGTDVTCPRTGRCRRPGGPADSRTNTNISSSSTGPNWVTKATSAASRP